MRTITLELTDEQFIELYAFGASYTANKKGGLGLCVLDQVHEVCEEKATGIEKEIVKEQVNRVREILLKEDSPDTYLLKAGLSGIIEQLHQ